MDVKLLNDNHFKNLVKTNITFKMIDKTSLIAYQRNANQLLNGLDKELESQRNRRTAENAPQ